MLAIVGMRVHESLPVLPLLHPAVIVCYGGLIVLLTHTSSSAIEGMLRQPIVRLIAVYFGWALISAPFALWPGLAFQTSRNGISSLVLAIALLLCRPTEKSLRFCTRGFLWAAVVLGVVVMIHGATSADGGVDRLTTDASLDSNDLAAVMAMAVPFGFGALSREGGWARLAAAIGTAVCVLVVIKTGSRGGTLALLAGALIYTIGIPGYRKVAALVALLIGLGATWTFAPPDFRTRISSISSPEEDYNYSAYSGRKQIWSRARGYIREHPVAGVGIGNFPIAEGDYAAALGRPAKWSAAHNSYLQAFAELGFVGGIIFLLMLGTSMGRAWRMWKPGGTRHHLRRPEFLASIGAFCTSGYFLSHAYFYPLFGVLALTSLAFTVQGTEPVALQQASSARGRAWRVRPAALRGVRLDL
jgi:O-antigen ligase